MAACRFASKHTLHVNLCADLAAYRMLASQEKDAGRPSSPDSPSLQHRLVAGTARVRPWHQQTQTGQHPWLLLASQQLPACPLLLPAACGWQLPLMLLLLLACLPRTLQPTQALPAERPLAWVLARLPLLRLRVLRLGWL